jgi:SnoaL-like domain
MNHHILPLLLVLLPFALPARAQPDPAAAIGHTLDALHAAAAQADGARYFALFTLDAVFIGTDAAERWPLAEFKAYAEPFFTKGQGWTYHPRERHVTFADVPCGCIAWFDELLDSESYGTSRGTGVVVKEGDAWKVAQYALSFPIPNDLAAKMTAEIRAFEARVAAP